MDCPFSFAWQLLDFLEALGFVDTVDFSPLAVPGQELSTDVDDPDAGSDKLIVPDYFVEHLIAEKFDHIANFIKVAAGDPRGQLDRIAAVPPDIDDRWTEHPFDLIARPAKDKKLAGGLDARAENVGHIESFAADDPIDIEVFIFGLDLLPHGLLRAGFFCLAWHSVTIPIFDIDF